MTKTAAAMRAALSVSPSFSSSWGIDFPLSAHGWGLVSPAMPERAAEGL
jgi:hypothetical protein